MADSGCLDNVVEFLVMVGNRSLPEAMMTLVPEAWQNDNTMQEYKKKLLQVSLITAWRLLDDCLTTTTRLYGIYSLVD